MDTPLENEEIRLKNNCVMQFNEGSEFERPLFDWKEISICDDNLHDTIPHEDEMEELELFKSKSRKNLRAKKRKKSQYEIEILEEHFAKDPEWSRKTVKLLKPLLNLTVDQIYKWGYDRKHLVEKRKMNVTRKKRVRKAKTMQAQENKDKLVMPYENLEKIEEDENNAIHDFVFDQIAWNSYPFEQIQTPKNNATSIGKEICIDEKIYQLKHDKESEFHSDDKIDKIFFENSSDVIEMHSSINIKEIFSQDESDFFIGNLY